MAWGNHAESSLPTALSLLALVTLFPVVGGVIQRRQNGHLLPAFLVGLSSGLALGLSLLAATSILALGLLFALARPRFAAFASLTAGGLVGLLPWFVFNASQRFAGLGELRGASSVDLGIALPKAIELIVHRLPAYLAPGIGANRAVELIFPVAVLLALTFATARALGGFAHRELRVEALFALPVLVFIAAYSATGFWVGDGRAGLISWHYLPPVTPFLLAGLATLLERVPVKGGALALLLVLGPSLVETGRRAQVPTTTPFQWSGASYYAYGWRLHGEHGEDLARAMTDIALLPGPASKRAALRGLVTGFQLTDGVPAWSTEPIGRNDRIASYIERSRETGAEELFLERLSLILSTGDRMVFQHDELTEFVARFGGETPDVAGPLVRAAMVAADRGSASQEVHSATLEALLTGHRQAAIEGLGIAAARRATLGEPPLEPPTVEQERLPFAMGYGFEIAWSRLVSGDAEAGGAPPPELDTDGLDLGVARALDLFDPDDPARRDWLAATLALRPLR